MEFSLADGRSRKWDDMRDFAEKLLAPGFGKPQSATYPSLHPTDDVVAATADVRDSMEGHSAAWVALFRDGSSELVRKGSRPTYSPDGSRLACIAEEGVVLWNWCSNGADSAPLEHQIENETLIEFKGAIERLAWNPDGTELLIVLAEPGAQLSNVAAGGLLPPAEPWLPQVSSSSQQLGWRRLIVIDVATSRWSTIGRESLNVWDAVWAGNDAIVAVCTDGSPTEGAWYTADIRRIDISTSADTIVVTPSMQLGALAATATQLAYVEAVCSDRDIAAGDLFVVDLATGDRRAVDTPCDVTDVQFVDDTTFGFCGMRNLTTVVGTSTIDGDVKVAWESERDTILGIHPHASFRADGRIAFVTGGHKSAPAVNLLRGDALETVTSMAHAGTAHITDATWTTEHRTWNAPDGLECDGWLLTPDGAGPHKLVVWVHGGPLWSHRTNWMGTSLYVPYLLEKGYAVFQPNPRGSSGKGLKFGAAVVNDMGGADTHDIISGVQSLVDAGIADPARLGVTGGSYGGYMTAWLITQTDLFKSAVSQYPITDWGIQHGAASIPDWDAAWLDGQPYALDGQYRDRSPITHAAKVVTPTLFIAGALDGCVPPAQALAMHRALLHYGVATDCVTYPQEGHGARDLSAVIDVGARITDWFDETLGGENG